MTNSPKQISLNKVLLNDAGLGCESGHVAGSVFFFSFPVFFDFGEFFPLKIFL